MGMTTTTPTPGVSQDLRELQKEVLEGLELPEDEDEEEKDEARLQVAQGLAALEELVFGASRSTEVSRPATGGPSVLSENSVLVASGEDSVEEVRHLVFRFQRLRDLSAPQTVDLGRMQLLEVLSLSHNQLRDLTPLSQLVSLSEVNLNFNQIEDLSPLFDCLQLTKVFAAHNRISSVAGVQKCQHLQELSLLANALGQDPEAVQELLRSFSQLPQLRSLDLAENGPALGGTMSSLLFDTLPQLQLLDGQGPLDPSPSPATPLTAAPPATTPPATRGSPRRPGTAPVPKPPKPPRPPEGAGYPMGNLPGDLRSARSNRMDEVLTKSEAPTPESPKEVLKVLRLQGEALQRQLETQHAERENLRFQVRLLERDLRERKVDYLEEELQSLEAENRNQQAVQQETTRLLARRRTLQEADAELDTAALETGRQIPGANVQSKASMATEMDEDDLDLARWECKRLEKRLAQARSYNCQLLQELERSRGERGRRPFQTEEAAEVGKLYVSLIYIFLASYL